MTKFNEIVDQIINEAAPNDELSKELKYVRENVYKIFDSVYDRKLKTTLLDFYHSIIEMENKHKSLIARTYNFKGK